jgi:cytochrome c biogenesis protein CcmG, thiol:disulfide interchange protein DsbE
MPRIRPLMLLPPLIFLGLAAMFYVGNYRADRDVLPSARVGGPAPAVVVTPLGTTTPFADADLRAGQVTVVNYWASWCAPCRAEHPILQEIADSGIPVYGVNYRDDPARALAFLRELGDPFAGQGADASGRMALDWGLAGVPETFIVAGDGTVVMRWAGPITREILDNRIRPAIARAAGGS